MRKLENVLKELKVVFEHHIVKEFNSDGYVCKYSLNPWHTWHDIEEVIRKHIDGDWIPAKERLPEGQTRVICQFDNGDIELLWQDWESDPETLTYLADFSMMAEKKVIAWKPLPDPYLPKKDN